jgi:hypothetical protein
VLHSQHTAQHNCLKEFSVHLVDTSPQSTSPLTSIAEAARLTGTDRLTVLRLAEEGVIPSEVRRLVDIDALRRHLAANPQESA